jgi:hypothetical protein
MTKRLSREEIERRLLELERSPQPEALEPGAMCYSPAPPPDYWMYVCPACGKRTAYVLDRDPDEGGEGASDREASDGERRVPRETLWDVQGMEAALSVARKLPKRSGISLDESALCVFCRPDAEEYVAALEIRFTREAPRRLPLKLEDVNLLRAFLSGSDRYPAGFGSEQPLRGEVRRLRRLLLDDNRTQGPNGEE